MGVSWSIETETDAEFVALRSEGAPECHMTYTSAASVMDAAGVAYDVEDYYFAIPADRVAEVAEVLAVAGFWQAEEVAQVCAAAARLGRGVSAA